ncbi:hypothetical protein CF327_g2394 [Tilletia walkeri]|nr:hypothetical protein CF327_g2394 [Tilletia walkeri]
MSPSFDRKRKLLSAAASVSSEDQTGHDSARKRFKLDPEVRDRDEDAETTPTPTLEPIAGEIARLVTVNAKGVRHIIRLQDGEVFAIGRSPDCDYPLESPRASRKHVKFLALRSDVTGRPHVVCEDSSRFGVFVNGLKIDRRFVLSHGDEINAAGQKFKLDLFEESTAQPQAQGAEGVYTSYQIPSRTRILKQIGSVAMTDRILGSGTYASVYLGFDTQSKLHKQVAIKAQLKRVYVPGTHVGVHTELELIRTLRHPNINRILAFHEDETHHFMVLELHQIDLFGYIQNWGAIQVPTAKYIKPENIYIESAVSSFPRICLGDFGLAYRPPEYSQGGKATGISSRTFSFCGTLGYLPPEVFKQHVTAKGYDPRALDMWSCGVTLFFALSATHPFDDHARIPEWKVIRSVITEEMIADGELPPLAEAVRSSGEVQGGSSFDALFDQTPRNSMISLAQELVQLGVDPHMSMPVPFEDIVLAQQQQEDKESDIDGESFFEEQLEPQQNWQMERQYLRNIMHGELPGIPSLLINDPAGKSIFPLSTFVVDLAQACIAGQSMIAGLINVSSEERLTATTALSHEWFTSAQPGLSTMYNHRVLAEIAEHRC